MKKSKQIRENKGKSLLNKYWGMYNNGRKLKGKSVSFEQFLTNITSI